MARLKEKYNKEIAPQIAKDFDIKNPMAIPRIEKNHHQYGNGRSDQQLQNSRYSGGTN